MLNKQITRKQFLLSALSIAGLVALSKVPTFISDKTEEGNKESTPINNGYGNSSYGG